jgi:hypothetical protein
MDVLEKLGLGALVHAIPAIQEAEIGRIAV